jgi:hypothetical protein
VTQPLSQGLWGVLATPFDVDLAVDLESLCCELGDGFASLTNPVQ